MKKSEHKEGKENCSAGPSISNYPSFDLNSPLNHNSKLKVYCKTYQKFGTGQEKELLGSRLQQ